MDFENLTKEELIKLCIKQDKALNKKKIERLSWKKIMNGTFVKGPGYWSNGHFALKNKIAIPAAITALKNLYWTGPVETTLETLLGDKEHKADDREHWTNETLSSGMNIVRTKSGVGFQKLYITVLDKMVPGFSLEVAAEGPAIIKLKGETVGLLMPTRD